MDILAQASWAGVGMADNDPTPGAADIGASWPAGSSCPCRGSKFDLARRVFKNLPAPTDLVVPPYPFASSSAQLIGADPKA